MEFVYILTDPEKIGINAVLGVFTNREKVVKFVRDNGLRLGRVNLDRVDVDVISLNSNQINLFSQEDWSNQEKFFIDG